jgi:Mg-chelatase subunit ChlD
MLALTHAPGYSGASLAPDAKLAFRIVPSASNIDEAARQASNDLPDQLRSLLAQNQLEPTNYDLRVLLMDPTDTTYTRPTLRIIWIAATAKATATGGEASTARYTKKANSLEKALIIYLLDVSGSMGTPLGERSRIDVVTEALRIAIDTMIFRSTKGQFIRSKYLVAVLAYSEDVQDLLGGVKTIDQVARIATPSLSPQTTTRTAKAFLAAEQILARELPSLQACPAPLVCHITDGEFNGPDPEPVVKRIMAMSTNDGNVLCQHCLISPDFQAEVGDPKKWGGILAETPLRNPYAAKLQSLSSPVPESYQDMLRKDGYNLHDRAVMLLPGTSPDMVALGFQMSTATPVAALH